MSKPARLEPAFKPAIPGPLPRRIIYTMDRKPEGWVLSVFSVPMGLLDGEQPLRQYGPDPQGIIENAFEREMYIASEWR